MFIRWRKHKLRGHYWYVPTRDLDTMQPTGTWERFWIDGKTFRSVALVKSVRINGKPRQKQIRYLGSYNVDKDMSPERIRILQYWFWQKADIALAEAVPDEPTRAKLTAKLETMVPRP